MRRTEKGSNADLVLEQQQSRPPSINPLDITKRFKFLLNVTLESNNRIFCSIVIRGDIVLRNMAITWLLMTRQIVRINVHPSALLAILLSSQLPGAGYFMSY